MVPYKRILFPTDFSDGAAAALTHAKQLAQAFDAELHVLFVEDDPTLAAETTSQEYRDAHAEKIKKLYTSLCGSLSEEDCKVKFVLRTGDAALEIDRYAIEAEADLIVLGRRGRGALFHALLGSVANNVLRNAPCPVLAVRDPNRKPVID